MQEGGPGHAGPYGHHVPMDLHVPQHFPYYAGCIMDNQAMFTAQQMQYNKMYAGMDPSRRMDELAVQGGLNRAYGQHPKEKSRDAARSRRGKENFEFYELAKMLPLPGAITSQLDKASIVRLTIAYLRLREFAAHGDPPWNRDGRFDGKTTIKGSAMRRVHNHLHHTQAGGLAMDVFEEHEGTHILQSLDGFAISLASDGRFLYISETVSIYLGLSQVELTGSSFFDYIHQDDHDELADQLGVTLASPLGETSSPRRDGEEGVTGPAPAIPDVCYPVTTLMLNTKEDKDGRPNYDRAFCIRMKSTLTKRGCHFKSSGYRVVLMLGKLRPQYSYSHTKKCNTPIMGFIGLAIALPPPSVHEVRLETDMFVTRLAFDFKIAHCEPKVSEMLDYSAEDLTGKSMYSLVHGSDVEKIRQTHVDLIKKGQVMSNYYRMMNRTGGYTWMQICATLVCNNKNSDEQTIICVNYVLSGSHHSGVVMDKEQNDQPPMRIKTDTTEEEARNGSPESLKGSEYSPHGVGDGGETYHYPGAVDESGQLRLGKKSVATTDNELKCSSSSPLSQEPRPTPPPTSSPSPHRYSTPLPPDQNSNSVRDLETAMSKHLPPREKEALPLPPPPTAPPPTLEASHLLKQIYTRPSYFPDLDPTSTPESSQQFLNYARLASSSSLPYPPTPAQPLPLKPNPYPGVAGHGIEGYTGAFAASTDPAQLYSHSSSSFHLYNRGQSWYTGN